jgi:hypothetical protein
MRVLYTNINLRYFHTGTNNTTECFIQNKRFGIMADKHKARKFVSGILNMLGELMQVICIHPARPAKQFVAGSLIIS